MAASLLALFALASQLRPNEQGWGTHEQLGLPRCIFLTLFGKRCPACGMTTAWANVTQGRYADAVRAHATGTLAALVAALVAVLALVVALRGKRLAWQPSEIALAGGAALMVTLVLGEWVIRLLIE